MAHGAIIRFIRRLNAAFCHHGIGVAHAQLGDHEYRSARRLGFQSSRASGAPRADNQHIRFIISRIKVLL